MAPTYIVDLSSLMEKVVGDWRRLGHRIDWELLAQCAYYPRGGCSECSWQSPNQRCDKAHILWDTRVNPGDIPPPLRERKKVDKKGETAWGRDISYILRKLPQEAREEIEKIMERR